MYITIITTLSFTLDVVVELKLYTYVHSLIIGLNINIIMWVGTRVPVVVMSH
jgi:hypothetical protein